ncbi:MAG: hypothetical protein GX847_01890 [Clostridiales bacterium]|nr:hypothetical protein [Clostridiales bacterium]
MKLLRFSKLIVAAIITVNIIFTGVVLYIFLRTGREPSTLIISWFAFTTGELGALAGLRHSENRNCNRDAE